MFTIHGLELGPVQTNCFIVKADTKECLIIDPGEEDMQIKSYLDENGLQPLAILLTHAHFDHIGAVDALRDAYAIPVYLHEKEQDWLSEPQLNGSGKYAFIPDVQVRAADHLISTESELEIGPFTPRIIHTPGHSPGSVSFVFQESGFAVVGDTLFRGSIGRTDLVEGSLPTLLKSIRESLLTLPGDFMLYPGHGPETTPDVESKTNPFLK